MPKALHKFCYFLKISFFFGIAFDSDLGDSIQIAFIIIIGNLTCQKSQNQSMRKPLGFAIS